MKRVLKNIVLYPTILIWLCIVVAFKLLSAVLLLLFALITSTLLIFAVALKSSSAKAKTSEDYDELVCVQDEHGDSLFVRKEEEHHYYH